MRRALASMHSSRGGETSTGPGLGRMLCACAFPAWLTCPACHHPPPHHHPTPPRLQVAETAASIAVIRVGVAKFEPFSKDLFKYDLRCVREGVSQVPPSWLLPAVCSFSSVRSTRYRTSGCCGGRSKPLGCLHRPLPCSLEARIQQGTSSPPSSPPPQRALQAAPRLAVVGPAGRGAVPPGGVLLGGAVRIAGGVGRGRTRHRGRRWAGAGRGAGGVLRCCVAGEGLQAGHDVSGGIRPPCRRCVPEPPRIIRQINQPRQSNTSFNISQINQPRQSNSQTYSRCKQFKQPINKTLHPPMHPSTLPSSQSPPSSPWTSPRMPPSWPPPPCWRRCSKKLCSAASS